MFLLFFIIMVFPLTFYVHALAVRMYNRHTLGLDKHGFRKKLDYHYIRALEVANGVSVSELTTCLDDNCLVCTRKYSSTKPWLSDIRRAEERARFRPQPRLPDPGYRSDHKMKYGTFKTPRQRAEYEAKMMGNLKAGYTDGKVSLDALSMLALQEISNKGRKRTTSSLGPN